MNATGILSVERAGKTLVVTPQRNLGGLSREDVQDECGVFLRRLEDSDAHGVVLDLGSVNYFGSVLLDFVVGIRAKLRPKMGKLAICHLTPVGSEVFHVAHFDSHFAKAPTRGEAVELVNG